MPPCSSCPQADPTLGAACRAPKSSEAQLAGALQAEAGVLDASLARIKGHIAQLASAQAGKAGASTGPESAAAAGASSRPGGGSISSAEGAAATQGAAGAGAVEALRQELEQAHTSVSPQAEQRLPCMSRQAARMPPTGAAGARGQQR